MYPATVPIWEIARGRCMILRIRRARPPVYERACGPVVQQRPAPRRARTARRARDGAGDAGRAGRREASAAVHVLPGRTDDQQRTGRASGSHLFLSQPIAHSVLRRDHASSGTSLAKICLFDSSLATGAVFQLWNF